MGRILALNVLVSALLFPQNMAWKDYETASILVYTRLTNKDSVEQGVLVLVNDAVFAYFNSSQETFLLRPSGMSFSVLGYEDSKYCLLQVTDSLPRQQDYLKKLISQANGAKPAKLSPSVTVYSQMSGSLRYLYCYATGFYPGDIEISFLLNGHPFPGPRESSDLMYGEDWTFRVFKYIVIHPHPGAVYSCMVNHSSLVQPKITIWRPEVWKTTGAAMWWIPAVAAGVGAALGCLISVCVWRKEGRAWTP